MMYCSQINEIYHSTYDHEVYTPIYGPAIIFYDEEELEQCAEA